MQHNRMFTYLAVAAVVAAVLIVVGAPFASLLPFALLLACPLMMVFMMRGMSGSHGSREDHTGHGSEDHTGHGSEDHTGHGCEDHTGHGCEHDPTHKAEPPAGRAR